MEPTNMPSFISLNYMRNRMLNPGRCVGFQQVTVDSTALGLDLSVCTQQPRYAICTLESDVTGIAARYLITGAAPTSSVGMPLANFSSFDIVCTEDMVRFKIIESQAGTTVLNIMYFV